MNYVLNTRLVGKRIIEEQMININILYAVFGKKVVFASPNKENMKNKVLRILNDNHLEYIVKENNILFNSNGKIEFV